MAKLQLGSVKNRKLADEMDHTDLNPLYPPLNLIRNQNILNFQRDWLVQFSRLRKLRNEKGEMKFETCLDSNLKLSNLRV